MKVNKALNFEYIKVIINKKEIKVFIERCDEKGRSEHDNLDLLRRIVYADPRQEDEKIWQNPNAWNKHTRYGTHKTKRRKKGLASMLFQKKKKKPDSEPFTYDSENEKPILKCSICNGEQVAGFKDIRTGKFHEVMFVRNEKDLQAFMDRYGLSDVAKEY